MKILVTGGAGFIGHNVVAKLEQLGHQCIVIDNKTNYGIIPAKKMFDLHKERKQYYKSPTYKIDLSRGSNKLEEIVSLFKPEIIIHLAGYPRQTFVSQNPRLASDVMIGGTIDLLTCAKRYNVKRFVFISSSMVYGNFTEDIDENGPTNPVGSYGILKLAGERLVKDFCKDIQYNIIRPSAVYGTRDINERVVNKFFLSALQDMPLLVRGKTEKLDFTFVDDVVDGIILASLNEIHFNKIYNITRSRSRTLLEAAELVVKIVGRGKIEITDKDSVYPSRSRLKIDKAKELGYTPKVDIEDGFKVCYEWIKNTVC